MFPSLCLLLALLLAGALFLSRRRRSPPLPPGPTGLPTAYGLKGFAFTPYGDYWRRVRKLCITHILSGPKIASQRAVRTEEIDRFVQTLAAASETRSAVNLQTLLWDLVHDVVSRTIVGRRYEAGDEEGDKFRACTKELMALLGCFNVNDFIPLLKPFDVQGYSKRLHKLHLEFDELLEKIVDEHQKAEKKGEGEMKDFVDVLLELMETEGEADGVTFDRLTVKAVVFDMLEASMDTMRIPAEWALAELIKHPRIMRKAQKELETVVGLHRKVEETDLPKLEYLHMVLKETLRFHPLSGFMFHHGTEECVINGYRIPKGANVMISLWSIGRDPAVWDNPEEFRPERFIDNNIEFRGDFRLLSFGSGRRMCAGMQLALIWTPLIIAQMIHCFDWELPDGVLNLDMKEAYGFTLPRADPLKAIPRKRLLNM
ncbi:uncharacterized protein A4U43_C06F10790 [Asparagus officinalis]|uniref:Cytochrome P450 n=1 Tax=Asparagus officinalis TaxID=4686 RepID=A0A5P1ELZ0_ASPOF|nr:cytochrome P450 CYP736A12-like [Asparagus officinalis]ONK66673.1 uncharacterized protein A4U43_C06F10790 [Asparagus officinalis]